VKGIDHLRKVQLKNKWTCRMVWINRVKYRPFEVSMDEPIGWHGSSQDKYGSTDDGMDHHPWMAWINRRWNGSSLDSMDQQMMEWIITG
jgi:hypothetical protein